MKKLLVKVKGNKNEVRKLIEYFSKLETYRNELEILLMYEYTENAKYIKIN
jgi:hypothetical protein